MTGRPHKGEGLPWKLRLSWAKDDIPHPILRLRGIAPISQIHQGGDHRPRFVRVLMLPAIRLFDGSKNLAPAIHMLNGDAKTCQITILLFLGLRQFAPFGLLMWGGTVGVHLLEALIAGISIFLDLCGDP